MFDGHVLLGLASLKIIGTSKEAPMILTGATVVYSVVDFVFPRLEVREYATLMKKEKHNEAQKERQERLPQLALI